MWFAVQRPTFQVLGAELVSNPEYKRLTPISFMIDFRPTHKTTKRPAVTYSVTSLGPATSSAPGPAANTVKYYPYPQKLETECALDLEKRLTLQPRAQESHKRYQFSLFLAGVDATV